MKTYSDIFHKFCTWQRLIVTSEARKKQDIHNMCSSETQNNHKTKLEQLDELKMKSRNKKQGRLKIHTCSDGLERGETGPWVRCFQQVRIDHHKGRNGREAESKVLTGQWRSSFIFSSGHRQKRRARVRERSHARTHARTHARKG